MTSTTAPPPRGVEADHTYARLHHAIIRGDYLPNQRLIEQDLASSLQVGRAAVRMALARLEQDGIVERLPFKGAHVRSISEHDAIEILEARAALEGLVVRATAATIDAEESAILFAILQHMSDSFAGGDLLAMSDGNNRLHAALLRFSRHQTAARLLAQLQAQNVRHQYRTILVPGRARLSLAEHTTIVAAVVAHDTDAAEHAMHIHLSHVTDALRQSHRIAQTVER